MWSYKKESGVAKKKQGKYCWHSTVNFSNEVDAFDLHNTRTHNDNCV